MEPSKLIGGDFSLNTNTFHTGTNLHTAAVNGDKVTIEKLLKQQGADDIQTLNDGDKYGRTALVYTVFGEWYECAETLVRYGASVLQADCDKRSVLHWAAYLARPKFMKLFLEHVESNVEWNVGDKDYRTVLHYAAMQENSKCLRLLLKHLNLDLNKRNLNATDNAQMTALHWSVFYNHLENFKLLIREGADTTKRDAEGRCLLHLAALNPSADSVKIARILLKINSHFSRHLDRENRTALHLAVATGNEELVRELCAAEKSPLKNVDSLSRSVLHYAVLKNDVHLINVLISAGVSPYHVDDTGASVLHYAAKNNNVQIVKRLLVCLENFEDFTDKQGRTALMWAASEGSADVLYSMLGDFKSRFNVHASDDKGLTALHFACFAGHEKCVRLLLKESADVSQPDKLGQTALFKACQQGHRNIIDILMDYAGSHGIPYDANGHVGTLMDHERGNVRQAKLMGNPSPLFAIEEEPVSTVDTRKSSEWLRGSSSSAVERDTCEAGELLPRDKEHLPGCNASEGLKPERSPVPAFCTIALPMGHTSQGANSHNPGECNGGCTSAVPKPCIKYPGGSSSGVCASRLKIRELEDDNGCTPLHFAAHAGHTPVCRWLLSQGVDPGKKDTRGRTALHGAAFNGHTECMQLMLTQQPELADDRDNDGYSVLHNAAINGQLEAVKLLVGEPYLAKLNDRVRSKDWTPLDFAMAAEHQDVTQFLMDNGALTIAWLQDRAANTIKRSLRRLAQRRREAKVMPLIEMHKKLTEEESLKHSQNEAKMKSAIDHDVTDGGQDADGCQGNDDVSAQRFTQETSEGTDFKSDDDRFTEGDDESRMLTKIDDAATASERTPLTTSDGANLGHHDDVTDVLTSESEEQSGRLVKHFKPKMESGEDDEHGRLKRENSLEKNRDKATLIDNPGAEELIKTRELAHEISSGTQSTPTSSASAADQDSRHSQSKPIARDSESFLDAFTSKALTSNIETNHENNSIEGNPTRHAKHLPVPGNFTRDNSVTNTNTTFAQTNVANLSRAPDSVVEACGRKEVILQLRGNWQRIALLRRKKQAAIVIQRYFRKHLEAVTSRDAVCAEIASPERGNFTKNGNKQSDRASPLTKNFENIRIAITELHEKEYGFSTPKTSTANRTDGDKVKDEKLSSLKPKSRACNLEVSSPKITTRKRVVNRLRTVSPEYSSSENEPFRGEKRELKSTFPLLSPKSSSTSSNGLSPSNLSVERLRRNRSPGNMSGNRSPSNKRADVAPILSKNELVKQWLSDGLACGNSSHQEELDTEDGNKLENNTKSWSATKTDPSKVAPAVPRIKSSQSARTRRDSLIKNVYGSPAAHSYNFALDTYHPLASRRGRKETAFPFRTSSRLRPNSMKRVEGGWVRTPEYTQGFPNPNDTCNNSC